MVTTSLRLPADVLAELKRDAQAHGVRYSTYIRDILEQATQRDRSPELSQINERLARIEQAVTRQRRNSVT